MRKANALEAEDEWESDAPYLLEIEAFDAEEVGE
jgi:hypothetical protein